MSNWTPKQEAALRKLWMKTPLSSTEIAKYYQNVIGHKRTRSAVIGKIWRMKLPMRCPHNSHKVPRHRSHE